MRQTPYLGKDVPPETYYRVHAASYDNPHREGVEAALARLDGHLPAGGILDLGCGDGLVTRWLLRHRPDTSPFGADASPEMVARYRATTRCGAVVAAFSDELPRCEAAVAAHALHLATGAEAATVWWRLAEAGARVVLVISPFRERPSKPTCYYAVTDVVRVPFGARERAVHAYVCERTP